MSEFEAVVICDDVRREMNGKDLLIGVYAGDIVTPIIPFQLVLSFWLEWHPPSLGRRDLYFRVTFADQTLGKVKIEATIGELTPTTVALPGLLIAGMNEGELLLEYSSDDREWTLLKKKMVRKGPVPSTIPAPLPAASGG